MLCLHLWAIDISLSVDDCFACYGDGESYGGLIGVHVGYFSNYVVSRCVLDTGRTNWPVEVVVNRPSGRSRRLDVQVVDVTRVNQPKLRNHPQQHFFYREPIVFGRGVTRYSLRVQLRRARKRAVQFVEKLS